MDPTIAQTAGIDISKDMLDVCLYPSAIARRFANTATGFTALIAWLDRHPVGRVIFEPTGAYHHALERRLAQTRHPAGQGQPAAGAPLRRGHRQASQDRCRRRRHARPASAPWPGCRRGQPSARPSMTSGSCSSRAAPWSRTEPPLSQPPEAAPLGLAQAPHGAAAASDRPPARRNRPGHANALPGRSRPQDPARHPRQHPRHRRGHRADHAYRDARTRLPRT